MSQATVRRGRPCHPESWLLFHSGLHLTGRGCSMGRATSCTQSTSPHIHLIQRQPHRHTQHRGPSSTVQRTHRISHHTSSAYTQPCDQDGKIDSSGTLLSGSSLPLHRNPSPPRCSSSPMLFLPCVLRLHDTLAGHLQGLLATELSQVRRGLWKGIFLLGSGLFFFFCPCYLSVVIQSLPSLSMQAAFSEHPLWMQEEARSTEDATDSLDHLSTCPPRISPHV
jgi:hypothetical protein